MKLNVISSNIRFANPADGRNDWEFRRPHLLSLIHEHSPDILGTQEGREGQIKNLAEGLPELTLVDGHRKWIEERMYPCLFINQKKFTILESGDIWLSETPHVAASKSFESSFPRLCVWAKVKLNENGKTYLVVNTHLDHVLQDTRIQQAHVLAREIAKLGSDPVVLMGDFNESPLTEVKAGLIEHFKLKDPWEEKGYPEETSHHSFKGVGATGDRIDWILVPQVFDVIKIELLKKDFEGQYPSDHFPLLATLIPN